MKFIRKLSDNLKGGVSSALRLISNHRKQFLVFAGVMGGLSLALAVSEGKKPEEQNTIITSPVTLKSATYDSGTLSNYAYSSTNETADTMLSRLGAVDARAAAFIRSDKFARMNFLNAKNRLILAKINVADKSIAQLSVFWIDDNNENYKNLVINQADKGKFSTKLLTGDLKRSTRIASGVVRSTFFEASSAALVPISVAARVPSIFKSQINFDKLPHGANFSLVYDVLEAEGQVLRAGKPLGVEINTRGKKYSAVWFDYPENGAYYTMDGKMLANDNRLYYLKPTKYVRVSSPYGERFDPFTSVWKMHKGVDLAAPLGTPIVAVAKGKVEFAGTQRGYGRVVILRHPNGVTTLYAHMNSIAVRAGSSVAQGQKIGSVGQSGWATGAHVHFEFKVDQRAQNPLVALNKYAEPPPLAGRERRQFRQVAANMRSQLLQSGRLSTTLVAMSK